jgi:WD40 repeat protein
VRIWSTTDGTLKQTLVSGGEISALQFAPPDQIAIGRKDGSLALWNISSGTVNFEARKHSSAVSAICFTNDGTLMASGSDDLSAIIWDLASGKARSTLKGHELVITSLAFSPDNSLLAVGSGNASVVLWQVAKGKLDRVLR